MRNSTSSARVDALALERELQARVDGEVRFDAGSRAAYSTDASNFRQVPIGVVVPRTVDAAVEAVGVCREHDPPVVSRGGGTSLAGQCTNAAVVLDFSKYCHRVVSVDPQARTCVVEPGIVLDVLNQQLAPHGLRFGPEPATHPNCTLGGMIGNNSCGATAQRTGKVVDNIARLDVLLYDGTRFWCGETTDDEYAAIERHGDRRATVYRQLRRLRDEHADEIRDRYPDIPRRVSGYNLDSLLPENGFDVARSLVGSESTLVTVLRAELELVPVVKERTLVVLGFPDIAAAADAVPAVAEHEPIALEGVDHYLIHDEQLKRMNPQALRGAARGHRLPDGPVRRRHREEADAAARACSTRCGNPSTTRTSRSSTTPTARTSCGRSARPGSAPPPTCPGHRDTFEGWEDSAVPRTGSATTCATCAALRGVRLRRRHRAQPLRPLRSGLRAHPHPVRPVLSRRRRDVPAVHGARRRPRRALTAAPCPASTATGRPAASCYRGCSATRSCRLFERAQGALRPARPDEPRQGRRPVPRSTSTCGSGDRGRRASRARSTSPSRTTAARSPRPPTAASASASAASTSTTAAR